MRSTRSRYRYAQLAAIALPIVACGPSSNNSQQTFVGSVSTSDAVVGLSVEGSAWVFYVCGGSTSYASMTHWFSGSAMSSGGFDVGADGWSVHAQHDASGWYGTMTSPDGVSRAWIATAADPATLSGLYNVVDNGCRAGLVVSQSTPGGAALAQGTWCDGMGAYQQVTPIMPIQRTDRGIHAQVTISSAVRELYLVPVLVPLQ